MTHVRVEQSYLQTVVQEGVDNFNGETRGTVQAIPICVILRTRVHVECDVWPIRRRWRPWFWRRARRTRICGNQIENAQLIVIKSTYYYISNNIFRTKM